MPRKGTGIARGPVAEDGSWGDDVHDQVTITIDTLLVKGNDPPEGGVHFHGIHTQQTLTNLLEWNAVKRTVIHEIGSIYYPTILLIALLW